MGVGRIAHDEADVTTLHEAVMFEVVAGVGFAVDGHRLDVAALALATDGNLLAIFQSQHHLVEIRFARYCSGVMPSSGRIAANAKFPP